jgi:hypothetical protein
MQAEQPAKEKLFNPLKDVVRCRRVAFMAQLSSYFNSIAGSIAQLEDARRQTVDEERGALFIVN